MKNYFFSLAHKIFFFEYLRCKNEHDNSSKKQNMLNLILNNNWWWRLQNTNSVSDFFMLL